MVHDGAIFILGGWGMVMLDDVWKSTDGINWEKVSDEAVHQATCSTGVSPGRAPCLLRRPPLERIAARHSLGLLLLCGAAGCQMCESGAWSKRMFHVAVVFEGHIFLIGGFDG